MILITGATGTIGRPLIDALVRQGARVRAVSRTAPAAGLPAGVDVVQGDPSRPDSLTDALRDVTSIFLNPAALGNALGELLALARQHGTKRIVLLSALAVDGHDHRPDGIAAHHRALEDLVTGSGLEWVILRPGMFAANTIAQWAGRIRTGDVVPDPYPAATDAPIHERDVAEVAARALRTDELLGQRLPLTGPQSLTQEELVGIIAHVLGRPLRCQEIPPEVARKAVLARGVPAPFIDARLAMQADSVGRPAVTSDQVEQILGRPAHTFAEWVAEHIGAFGAPVPGAGQAVAEDGR